MEIDVFKLVGEYGIIGFLFALLAMITTAIIKSSWITTIWNKIIDKYVKNFVKKKSNGINHEISESEIINHDIFNYIDFWMYSKVPTFEFSTEYRTIIFRKYLTIYLKCYRRGILEFVQKKEYQDMDQSQLWIGFLDLKNKIVTDYEKEALDSGIPSIIILKMKSKNNETISLTIDLIESISNSQFYEGDKNFLKVYSILNIILSILENMISNSESVCNSINGQLKGLYTIENGKKIIEH